MFASRNGHSEVVNKLLDKGANIEAHDEVTYLISFQNLSRTLFDIDVDHYFDINDLSRFVQVILLYIIATCVISTIVVWVVDYYVLSLISQFNNIHKYIVLLWSNV